MSLQLLGWVLCAVGPWGAQAAPAPAQLDSSAGRARIAAWREALELDLAAEVLSAGPRAVAPGGELCDQGEAIALVARALAGAGRDAEARALLDGARPNSGAAWLDLERARVLLESDRLEQAVALARAEGSEPPRARLESSAEAWLLLGRALVRSGHDAQARTCLEQSCALEPLGEGTYSALHMLAQIALRASDGARAQELGARAAQVGQWRAYWRVRRLQVREHPDEPLPRVGLAQLLMQAGDFARARAGLDELVVRFPDYAPGWFHLGEVRRAQADAAGALEAYDRALALDPDLASARYNRAVLQLRAGRNDAARIDFEHLVAGPQASDPRYLAAHLGLARLLLTDGQTQAAKARHARYLELGGTEALAP